VARVRVVPHDHQGAAELLVSGVQQAGVAGLGEALARVVTVPAAVMDAVDQPRPAAGLDRDQRRQPYFVWPAGAGLPFRRSPAAACSS